MCRFKSWPVWIKESLIFVSLGIILPTLLWLLVLDLSWVSKPQEKEMSYVVGILPIILEYLSQIRWFDLLLLVFIWPIGIFFAKFAHILANRLSEYLRQ